MKIITKSDYETLVPLQAISDLLAMWDQSGLGYLITSTTAPLYLSETWTATGDGAASSSTDNAFPLYASMHALQVVQTGAVTSWDVRLEATIDSVNYQQVLQHTNVSPGNGGIVWNTTQAIAPQFRVRVAGLVLGAGTNIITYRWSQQ